MLTVLIADVWAIVNIVQSGVKTEWKFLWVVIVAAPARRQGSFVSPCADRGPRSRAAAVGRHAHYGSALASRRARTCSEGLCQRSDGRCRTERARAVTPCVHTLELKAVTGSNTAAPTRGECASHCHRTRVARHAGVASDATHQEQDEQHD
jgi:hypothetical protein